MQWNYAYLIDPFLAEEKMVWIKKKKILTSPSFFFSAKENIVSIKSYMNVYKFYKLSNLYKMHNMNVLKGTIKIEILMKWKHFPIQQPQEATHMVSSF